MIGALRKIGFAACFLGLAVAVSLLLAQKTYAARETYTWKDYRTITVTGGDTVGPADFVLNSNVPLQGDMNGALTGHITRRAENCLVYFTIYVYKTTAQGYNWAPAGPMPVPPEITNPGSLPSCNVKDHNYNLQLAYHDEWFNIQGARPQNPNAPERPEEKIFRVLVLAPDPLSTAPKTDSVYIYSGDGARQIMSLTAPFVSDSGAAQWPPDQTPVAMNLTFQNLDPGTYIVCDTYAAKNCTDPSKLTSGQRITKKKYDGSGSTTIGAQFQTPDKKRINAHVEYHTKRPCGSPLNVSPVQVEITGPDGTSSKVYDQMTNAGVSNPTAGENGSSCTVNVILGLYATFDNMPAGDYKVCTSTADAACVNVTKVDGQPADVTLVVADDKVAPPDQQVCTSGDGIAGALAWIICPATQLIASATSFVEENIIIPFLTTTPLTTNSSNPVYILWQSFRDLANVGFIVLLFVSIFSIALSKYGLKRALPRLLVVAIGINLSYFAVAFIIDVFNIFGAGVSQLITAALQQAGVTQLNSGTSAGTGSMFALGGVALLTILLTAGAALGWLFSFLGLAALVIMVAVVVLILRQIGIIMLVIVSSIAILLYMLPNTEGLFKKWRQLLIQLLMMYPMIVLLFAVGKIFGIILQQPDFKIAGDGVTDGVAQAVRVIMQFLVYVIPLVFLPATFMASGGVMGKVYGAFHKRTVQPRAQKLREDASHIAGETKLRMARIPGVGVVAGAGMRRNYVRETRRKNLEREQQEYLAGAASSSSLLRRQAAGVAGQAGQTRAAATAAKTDAKGRTEDLEAEKALLDQEMRRIGMDEDTFAEKTSNYLEDPSNPANRVITGSNGETFDFAANEGQLQRALLNSAASQGYIRAIEAARVNVNIDQTMLDDIIRRNNTDLEAKGGRHLTRDFNLAAGRMQVHDSATGARRAPASQEEAREEMMAQRLVAMSQTGANSIAGMKMGVLTGTGDMLNTPGPARDRILMTMDHIAAERNAGLATGATPVNYRQMLHDQMNQVLGSQQTIARSDADQSDFEHIRDGVL